ncbi:MAG: hypothetical protein U0694_07815 [Anaerolineae bacterium]
MGAVMLVRCVRLALPLLCVMLLILTPRLWRKHGDVLIYVAGERANNRIYLLDLTTRVAHALTPVGAYSQPVWTAGWPSLSAERRRL